MGYTAKHWTNLNNFQASHLNEIELGLQEAHEDIDVIQQELTNVKLTNDSTIKEINDLLTNSESMVDALKELEKLSESNSDIAEFLSNYGKDYLTKTSQSLSKEELKVIYKNLKLVDAVQSLTPSTDYKQIQIHNESYTSHQDIREALSDKASIAYVDSAIASINIPDNSGASIEEHNNDSASHQDIRNMINNIDLSGYALINHNHEGVYAQVTHSHPYAAEDHTHNYATPEYVDNKINSIDIPNINTEIHYHNTSDTAHQDIRDAIKNIDLSGYSKEGHTHNDYLPLTAGVNKKVTGALHVDNNITISNGKAYRAYDNSGTIRELLRLSTGNVIILGEGNSNLDIATHGTLRPSADKSLNLGTSTYPWTNIYGTTIYQNGKQVADKDHTHDYSDTYAPKTHNHDGVYAPFTHSHDYATPYYVDTAIANLVGAAPDALNTFEELAAALNNNKDILSTFLTKNNPSGTGSLSLNRKADTTIGTNSVALGTGTQATGNSSHAEGYQSKALGNYAHAEGYQTIAYGSAHAEGYLTVARNGYAHAEGYNTHAFGSGSHAEGGYTYTTTQYAHAEGQGFKSNPYFLVADPLSVSDYYITFALHEDSKNNTTHLNIFNAMTRGDLLHIRQGDNYYLYRVDSIDLTNKTMVCEAEFYKIDTSLDVSKLTANTLFGGLAIGVGAHCEGIGTIACGEGQHVFGIGNIADSNYSNPYRDVVKGDYIEIVGNGTYTSAKGVTKRSNARTLDWDGNEWLAGGLTTEGDITEAGTLLSNKYAAKSHTHDYAAKSHTHDYAASSHKHGLVHTDLGVSLSNTTTDGGWNMIASELSASATHNGFLLKAIRTNASAPNWILGNHGAGVAFGGGDTKGVLSVAYGSPNIRFAGGNSYKPSWYMSITGSSGSSYNLNNFAKVLKGTSATKSSNTTAVSTLRLGLVGSTLYIWTS